MSDQSESEEWCFEVRPKGIGRKQPRPIDDLCLVSSDSSITSDATSARWYETFATRVASSTCRPVGLGRQAPKKTQPRSENARHAGGDLKIGKESNHCCRRSENEASYVGGKRKRWEQEAVEMSQFCWPGLKMSEEGSLQSFFLCRMMSLVLLWMMCLMYLAVQRGLIVLLRQALSRLCV